MPTPHLLAWSSWHEPISNVVSVPIWHDFGHLSNIWKPLQRKIEVKWKGSVNRDIWYQSKSARYSRVNKRSVCWINSRLIYVDWQAKRKWIGRVNQRHPVRARNLPLETHKLSLDQRQVKKGKSMLPGNWLNSLECRLTRRHGDCMLARYPLLMKMISLLGLFLFNCR